MLGTGVGAASFLGDLSRRGAREYEASTFALDHLGHHQARQVKRTIQVHAHGLGPCGGVLLPDDFFVGRSDAVVANKYVHRAEALDGRFNREGATLKGAQIRRDGLHVQGSQVLFTARNRHHPGAARPQELGCHPSNSTACAGHQCDLILNSCHALIVATGSRAR